MTTSRRRGTTEPPTAQRLFAAQGAGLVEHQQRFGPLPELAATALVPLLDRSGLTGRGGAGFPAGRKIASVTGRKAVVISNGVEGEPLSHKDAELLSRAPHLVLDGLKVTAAAVSADKVVMYVPSRSVPTIKTALSERRSAKVDRHPVTVVAAPDGFVAGEESAVVRRVEGGPALPRDRTARTADVLGYLAGESARPCGPCRNGLPQLARLFDDLAYRSVDDRLLDEVRRMIDLIDGRGSRRRPDGSARLARSALEAFASDLTQHRHRRCEAALTSVHGTGRPRHQAPGSR